MSEFKFNIGDVVHDCTDKKEWVIARRWIAPNGWQRYYVAQNGICGYLEDRLVLVKSSNVVIADPPPKTSSFVFCSGGRTTVLEMTDNNLLAVLDAVFASK